MQISSASLNQFKLAFRIQIRVIPKSTKSKNRSVSAIASNASMRIFSPQKIVKYTAKSESADVAQKFVKSLERDIREIYKKFRKSAPEIYSQEERKNYRNSKEYGICKKGFEDDKIRDHCHYTGKYRGAPHSESVWQEAEFYPSYFPQPIWLRLASLY